MTSVDPEAGQLRADGCHIGLVLGVKAFTTVRSGLDQSVLLQLACERRRNAGPLAELSELDLVLFAGERRAAPAAAILPPRGGGVLPDHAQRQEFVPLQAQDRS